MRGADIADAVGADRDALQRVLRGLVIDDVLAEEGDGRFALTAVGACLTSVHGAALARGEVYYSAAAGLLEAVRTGGTAFEHVHAERFFDHLARHPDREAAFQASMADRSEQEARDVVASYDFGGLDDWSTSAAAGACCSPRSSERTRRCTASSSTARPRSRPPAPTSRRPRSPIAPTASPPTSSTRSPPVPAPTCSHG
jgi:hypothetical protein